MGLKIQNDIIPTGRRGVIRTLTGSYIHLGVGNYSVMIIISKVLHKITFLSSSK